MEWVGVCAWFYLQVVEDEKECFCGQSLVELYGVRVVRRYLMMEGQGGTRIPHQVLPLGQEHKQLEIHSKSSGSQGVNHEENQLPTTHIMVKIMTKLLFECLRSKLHPLRVHVFSTDRLRL